MAMAMAQDPIDDLLERYLYLVDEYTKLRAALTDLQAGLYQDLARANFAAERGIRYGQDFYDDRMQSLRSLVITKDDDDDDDGGYPRFEVVVPGAKPDPAASEEDQEGPEKAEGTASSTGEEDPEGPEKAGGTDEAEAAPAKKPRDPLRWFGLLAPTPLRQAQARAVRAVEEIIPKLASVDAEMAAVEIRVRRARKKRAKAEVAAEKETRAKEAEAADNKETRVPDIVEGATGREVAV